MNRRSMLAVLVSLFALLAPSSSAQCGLWRNFDAQGFNGRVHAFAVHDVGSGPNLYAGGLFTTAGGAAAKNVARWDGAHWLPLGAGLDNAVQSLISYDDGTGPALYAGCVGVGGGTSSVFIARWNGSTWTQVGTGLDEAVFALAVHDDGSGPALYAGGFFGNGVARWNGSTWAQIGSGNGVYALASFDDGSGRRLYAGGDFQLFGGERDLVRWDGANWSPVGSGVGILPSSGSDVRALAVHDDGSGPALYAGGHFTSVNSASAANIARWNGSTWSAVGTGFPSTFARLHSLVSYDSGSGAALYAGGNLSVPSLPYHNVARWNGTGWADLGGGTNGQVNAFAVVPQGSATVLCVGGWFTRAGGASANYAARWDEVLGCVSQSFCLGDGAGTPCPCANVSTNGGGCVNSFGTGATLSTTGVAQVSADTLVLHGDHMPNSTVLYFQGTVEVADGRGAVFGDGLRCVEGSVVRLGLRTNSGGSSQMPLPGEPSLSVRGSVPSVGGTRTYQAWYRDPAPFCTSGTFNLTNGFAVAWSP